MAVDQGEEVKAEAEWAVIREIQELEQIEIEKHNRILTKMERRAIEAVISPKVGDVITLEDNYSHRGKKMKVSEICWPRQGSGMHALGFLMKKDGTVGKMRVGEWLPPS